MKLVGKCCPGVNSMEILWIFFEPKVNSSPTDPVWIHISKQLLSVCTLDWKGFPMTTSGHFHPWTCIVQCEINIIAGSHQTASTTYLYDIFPQSLTYRVVYTSTHGGLKKLLPSAASIFLWGKLMFLHCLMSADTQRWHSVSLLACLRYSVHKSPLH